MKNIEFKSKVDDFSEVLKILKSIMAKYKGVLRHIDTYFYSFSGYFKHRVINGKENQLILYYHLLEPYENISNYKIAIIDKKNSNKVVDLLKLACREKVVIGKKRRLWLFKHTRIHLDEVHNLGRFIELETIIENGTEEDRDKEHHHIKQLLELDKYPNLRLSYMDLAMKEINDTLYQREDK